MRAILPTDLVALLARASSSSYENQAWPRERLGTRDGQPALGVLRDQLLAFGKQRSTWVSVKRSRLHALAGTRHRGSRHAWEVDYLLDCGAGEGVIAELLVRAIKAGGDSGVEKLFMRLDATTGLLQAVREAGFMPYQEETLFTFRGRFESEAAEVRKATPADSYPLFRLYTAATPEATRRHEAATYGEWLAAMESRWLRGGVQLLAEQGGRIRGAVRASRLPQGVLLDLTVSPENAVYAGGLVAAATQALAVKDEPLYALVPANNEALAGRLDEAGFEAGAEFVSLLHRTTRPLSLPKAAAAVAKNAIGV